MRTMYIPGEEAMRHEFIERYI
ncbi:hypothetical protein OIU78_017378 [Salix suchowensis]|nr:hypothetical protein OIU78_017378 [Salix suchowensis]